jgi:hypothetical protein
MALTHRERIKLERLARLAYEGAFQSGMANGADVDDPKGDKLEERAFKRWDNFMQYLDKVQNRRP